MYSFQSKVRFSEVDGNLNLTLPGILTYFQDCSIFHSDSIGLGIETLTEQGSAWILSSWQILVDRYPRLGEALTISTWACGYRGFFGYRNFTMEDAQKTMAARAYTTWIYMDIRTGHPTRIPQHVIDAYRCEEPLAMEQAPRKIRMPQTGTLREPYAVRRSDIDSNKHVNNAHYVTLSAEYLPEGFTVRQLRAEYKKAALYGDVFHPLVSENDHTVTVCLNDEKGSPYALIEFEREY